MQKHGDGCAHRNAVNDTGKNLHRVRIIAGGEDAAFTRTSPIEVRLLLLAGDLSKWRTAVNSDAVGFVFVPVLSFATTVLPELSILLPGGGSVLANHFTIPGHVVPVAAVVCVTLYVLVYDETVDF